MNPSEVWSKKKNCMHEGHRGPILKPNGQWVRATDILKEHYDKPCPKCDRIMYKGFASIDHIKPKSKYPELIFEYSNLEVICLTCNNEKRDDTFYELKRVATAMEARRKALAKRFTRKKAY